MANAAILIGGTVIQTTNISKARTSLDGFLTVFTITSINKVITHVNVNDFRYNDQLSRSSQISAGYYLESDFLNYMSGAIDLTALKPFPYSSYVSEATNTDTVFVKRLTVISPYSSYYNLASYAFPQQYPVLDPSTFEIIIPSSVVPTMELIGDPNAEANQFYNSRIALVENFIGSDKATVAMLITQCAILISHVNRDVFALLNTYPSFAQYIQSQNDEWINGNILLDPTIDSLTEFFTNIQNFYRVTYSLQNILLEADDTAKLYWLSFGLSIGALSLLSTRDKINILNYLILNKLNETFEEVEQEKLVIRILLSFNQENIEEITPFLKGLLDPPAVNADTITLYEALYKRMSTSTQFVSSFIGLTNWVFQTKYQPTTTKGQFVQVVYALWKLSDFCPYNDDGTFKSHVFSFTSSDSSLSDFAPNPTDPSAIFTYTHYVAYKQADTNPPTFPYTYPEAAPMVLPYESQGYFGLFFDNFRFKISGKKIVATQTLPPILNFPVYGTYDIFQPVSVLNDDLVSTTAIVTVQGSDITENGQNINGFIPVFVLEYIHAADDRASTETIVGFVADVASTFAGIGELAKLRYLRWAGVAADAGTVGIFTADGLNIVVSGVFYSSGVLGMFSQFITCGSDDDFCNALKTFVTILNLANLGVTAAETGVAIINSLASLKLQKTASNIITLVGGSDEQTIIQNIYNKLAALYPSEDPQILQDGANSIYKSGYLYSFPANIVASVIDFIKSSIISKKFILSTDYTDAVISQFITTCDQLNIDQRTIEDLVVFANRPGIKYVSPVELNLRVNFYVKEILPRKFTAGFADLNSYQTFCNSFKNTLLNNLNQIDPNLSNILENAEYVVKGSSVTRANASKMC